MDATAAPHPVFEPFPPWHGVPDPGCQVNFLGVQTSIAYFEGMTESPRIEVATRYPEPSEELFEWLDLLETVTAAKARFTMVELGAGWGRWVANAAAACRILGREHRLVAVEAEPTHFAWMREHLDRNGIDAHLVQAAVAAADGRVSFRVGAPFACYGQRILRSWRERLDWRRQWGGRTTRVRAVSLETLLDESELDVVDLLDLDVQSAEADVLEPAAAVLDERVRRVHVGTHPGDSEERLRALFGDLGWTCLHDYSWGRVNETPFGSIEFLDGVQTWANPRLARPDEAQLVQPPA